MRLTNETITVYNAKLDTEYDKDVYNVSVIKGVSWYCEIVSAVDDGLKAANRFVVRIPTDADFGEKSFVSPQEYAATADVSRLFTLASGDIIVKGEVSETGLKPKDLHRQYEAFTILGVTDNRRAPKAPHWKVVGS